MHNDEEGVSINAMIGVLKRRQREISRIGKARPLSVSEAETGLLGTALRDAAGDLAQGAGMIPGVVRGAFHGVKGAAEGARFIQRLASPLDVVLSPPGESAVDELVGAGKGAANYIGRGFSRPEAILSDVQNAAHRMRVAVDPTATPVGSTATDELRRRFGIGMNQGELGFDAGSLAIGGPLAKSVEGLGAVANVSRAEKYLGQGFNPGLAGYLAEPYPASGMGHHFFPRKLGLPPGFSDSVFNVLKPKGISRGDFYELHYKVDPQSYGNRLPIRFGAGGWSGAKLGLEKYGPLGRLWFGSPAPLKARVGGISGGLGSLGSQAGGEESAW